MKITYEYLTGEKVEIEVDEKFGEIVMELDREEYNNEHAETRRHLQLSLLESNSDWFSSSENDPGTERRHCKYGINDDRMVKAIDKLTKKQRQICLAVCRDGLSVTKYAEFRGVSRSSASRLIGRARKNIKKFY